MSQVDTWYRYNKNDAVSVIRKMIRNLIIEAEKLMQVICVDILFKMDRYAKEIINARKCIVDDGIGGDNIKPTVSVYYYIIDTFLSTPENDNELKKKLIDAKHLVGSLLVWRIQALSNIDDRNMFINNAKKMINQYSEYYPKRQQDIFAHIMLIWKNEVAHAFYDAPLSNNEKRKRRPARLRKTKTVYPLQ